MKKNNSVNHIPKVTNLQKNPVARPKENKDKETSGINKRIKLGNIKFKTKTFITTYKKEAVVSIISLAFGFILSIFNFPLQEFLFKEKNVENILINNSSFTAQNIKGESLWIKNVGSSINDSEILDIDNDRLNEVIIGTGSDGINPGLLLNINNKSKEIWEYKCISDNVFSESNLYTIPFFLVDDFNNDQQKEILVNAHNNQWFPTQLILLDNKGTEKSKFWHPGYIYNIKYKDIDRDNIIEFICGGINNYLDQCPVLFILKTNNMSGQAPPFLGNANNCHFMYYIRIPKSFTQPLSANVIEVSLLDNKIEILIDDGRYYDFNIANMKLMYIEFSDYYRGKLIDLSQEEKFEEENTLDDIEYY
jgi:hypothetical protein